MQTDQQIIAESLKAFGLSEAETAIYLTLLALGMQPASVLAKKATLKRGHTYNILHRLRDAGLVQEFVRDGVTFFTASNPKSLLSILDQRSEDVEIQKQKLLEAVPFLERIWNPLSLQPKVRLFQGAKGIKEIYTDTMRHADAVIYAVSDFAHIFPGENDKALNEWVWRYCERRAKKGVWYYGIVNKSPESDAAFKQRKEHKRKLKMLIGMELAVELNIYGDRTAIISSSKDMVGLIIEDKPIAETLRNFHQALWKMLPEYMLS
jgi:HTH-type transcriptional regulator, sugar sensing transcriptional regulator